MNVDCRIRAAKIGDYLQNMALYSKKQFNFNDRLASRSLGLAAFLPLIPVLAQKFDAHQF